MASERAADVTPTVGASPPSVQAAGGRPSSVRIWIMAARVRTLPASVAPVLVGTSLALGAGHFDPLAFAAALLGALFIQVGTNLSND
jgi:1,4-dihydroxy-2-naphthoate octaprenyltransferase